MGCCGQGRAALRSQRRSIAASPAQPPSPPVAPTLRGPELRLEHLSKRSLSVRGTGTGRTYAFSPTNPEQLVDEADAPALLRSGLFRVTQ